MADEQHEMLGGDRIVPVEHDWQSLLKRSGADLEAHYSDALAALGAGEDMLGVVFHKARNRIQTPAKLEQLIKEFIDQHEWMSYDADLKGDAYEGLIEKTAQEGARGAGQYFTPRAPINAIVDVMLSEPDSRIRVTTCGTDGFFLGAYRSIVEAVPAPRTRPSGTRGLGNVRWLADRRRTEPVGGHEQATTRHREPQPCLDRIAGCEADGYSETRRSLTRCSVTATLSPSVAMRTPAATQTERMMR